MIGCHKFRLLIRINELMLWFHKKNSLYAIFRFKVYFSIGINMDSHNNLFSFNDWVPQIHSTHWDKCIDAFVLQEKLFFLPFFRIKVHFSIGINTNSHNNLLSFNDWAAQITVLIGITELTLWFLKKNFSLCHFQN